MVNLGDFSTTRIEPTRGPLWPEVKAKLQVAGYEFNDVGSFTNIAACPHVHPEGSTYYTAMSWEVPGEDGTLFYVGCECGARGPLADDPVEAAAAWSRLTPTSQSARIPVTPPTVHSARASWTTLALYVSMADEHLDGWRLERSSSKTSKIDRSISACSHGDPEGHGDYRSRSGNGPWIRAGSASGVLRAALVRRFGEEWLAEKLNVPPGGHDDLPLTLAFKRWDEDKPQEGTLMVIVADGRIYNDVRHLRPGAASGWTFWVGDLEADWQWEPDFWAPMPEVSKLYEGEAWYRVKREMPQKDLRTEDDRRGDSP